MALCLLTVGLWFGSAQAQEPGTDKVRNRRAKQASTDTPPNIVIGPARDFTVICAGKTYKIEARTTGVEDEYLVRADEKSWSSIALVFGRCLSWQRRKLVVDNGQRLVVSLGQTDLPSEVGGRHLDVVSRMIGRHPYIPISCLEDLLGVRVTMNEKACQGWIDPKISSVRLEGDGRKPDLVVTSNYPVTFKTFTLKQPDRYVIDVAGGVLDTPSLRVNHPELGDIRLGQFTLGPAISRIVIPNVPGLKVTNPTGGAAKQLVFKLELPEVNSQNVTYSQQRLVDYSVEPIANGSRLQLVFSGPIQYEWTRLIPPDNRFFLDLTDVVLMGTKRVINVDSSYVKSVRISQNALKPRPITRAVIDLKKAALARVAAGNKPNSLILEVCHSDVEPSMTLLKGYGSTVAPVAEGTSGATGGGSLGGTGIICIDPGHGGSDPGAVHRGSRLTEKEVTFDICMRLAKILRTRGWKVLLTRETDRDVSWAGSSASEELWARVKVANEGQADVFVSIHCNAAANSAAQGTSCHVYKRADKVLAQELQPHLVAAAGCPDRGIQLDRFYVLVHSRMPSVLVETAFISNSEEAAQLAKPEFRQRVAEGLADGLGNYAAKYIKGSADK